MGPTRPHRPASRTVAAVRRILAGHVRLGMRLANGREVVEIRRPDPVTVKEGYGAMWFGFDDGDEGKRCPSDVMHLANDCDDPEDRTMDDWPGNWWKHREAML